jgi:hypothetical protein
MFVLSTPELRLLNSLVVEDLHCFCCTNQHNQHTHHPRYTYTTSAISTYIQTHLPIFSNYPNTMANMADIADKAYMSDGEDKADNIEVDPAMVICLMGSSEVSKRY